LGKKAQKAQKGAETRKPFLELADVRLLQKLEDMFMRIAGNSDWKGERQGRGMGYADGKLYSDSEF